MIHSSYFFLLLLFPARGEGERKKGEEMLCGAGV